MPKWFLVKWRNKELSADGVTLDQHAATYRMDDGASIGQHAATCRMDEMSDEKPDLQVSIDSASLLMTSSSADSGYSHSPSGKGVTDNDVTSLRPNENKDDKNQSRESSPFLGDFQDFQPLDLSTTRKSHSTVINQDTEISKMSDTSSLGDQSENSSPRISNQLDNGSPRISNQSDNDSPRISPNKLLFANIFLDRGCYPFQLPVGLSNRLPIHPTLEVLVPNRIPFGNSAATFVGGDRSEDVGPNDGFVALAFDTSRDIVGQSAVAQATTKRKRTHSSSQDPMKGQEISAAGNWEEGGIFSREAEMTPEAKAELENIPNKLGEYVCRLCFKLHKDAFELAKHSCSQIVRIEYRCVDCSKTFNCLANLASHRRWHRPKSVI